MNVAHIHLHTSLAAALEGDHGGCGEGGERCCCCAVPARAACRERERGGVERKGTGERGGEREVSWRVIFMSVFI